MYPENSAIDKLSLQTSVLQRQSNFKKDLQNWHVHMSYHIALLWLFLTVVNFRKVHTKLLFKQNSYRNGIDVVLGVVLETVLARAEIPMEVFWVHSLQREQEEIKSF